MKINAKNGFDIRFIKNNTYALLVTFKDIEEDLRSAFFTVKENPEDTTPVLQKTLGAGIFKVDDRAYKKEKKYKVQIQAEDTSNLEAEVQYLYDLQVTIDNVVKTVASGLFVVSPTITGDKSITSTEDIIAEVTDELETDFETSAPTAGVEYETDPVAMLTIGDMAKLNTSNKETIVSAINSVMGVIDNEQDARADGDDSIRQELLNGSLAPMRADIAQEAGRADEAYNAHYTSFTNKTWQTSTSPTLTAGTWQVYASMGETTVDCGLIYFDGTTAIKKLIPFVDVQLYYIGINIATNGLATTTMYTADLTIVDIVTPVLHYRKID